MIAKIIIIGWTLLVAYWFIAGVNNVTDGGSSDEIQTLAITFGMIVHFVLWCAIALPTFLISRLFRRREEPARS